MFVTARAPTIRQHSLICVSSVILLSCSGYNHLSLPSLQPAKISSCFRLRGLASLTPHTYPSCSDLRGEEEVTQIEQRSMLNLACRCGWGGPHESMCNNRHTYSCPACSPVSLWPHLTTTNSTQNTATPTDNELSTLKHQSTQCQLKFCHRQTPPTHCKTLPSTNCCPINQQTDSRNPAQSLTLGVCSTP